MGWPFGALPPIGPPTAPALPPPPQKPSILDRLAARLFPTGAYSGLLDPSQQQDVQHQGLMQLGANLLQAGGRSPQQRGTLANIGTALGGVNVNDLAQRALQLQAYRSQQQEQQAISAVAAHHPVMPGMSRDAIYNNQLQMLNELMTIPGGAAIAEKWAPVVAATKPDKPTALREPMRIDNVRDNVIGSPTHGLIGTILLDPDSMKRVGFVPQVQKEAAGKGTTALLMGEEARAAAQRLLTAEADGQTIEQASPGAAQPSTWAAFLGGVTQKVAGERAGSGVTQALRLSATNNYQSAAGRWTDAYMQMLPKSRQGSVTMRDQIQRTYWGQEGDSPATVHAKAAARTAATAALARAVASGTPPPLPGFEPEPTAP